MCDIWKIDTVEEISAMDLERYWKDIIDLRVRWVVFSGGEPLMHTDLFRLSRRLRESGIRTTALSTGLLLSKRAADLVGGLDDAIVSLDGPAEVHDRIRRVPRAFALLSNGVQKVHALAPGFPIGARCTVQRENFRSLRDTMRAARELGLCSVSFLAVDMTSTAFNRPEGWTSDRQREVALSSENLPILEEEIESLIEEAAMYPGFVLETPEKLRRIVHHFRAHLGFAEPIAPRCNAPWVSAVMESDGTVRPCFFHAPIGNAKEQGLAEVLNSARAIAFRESLVVAENPICSRCVCSLYHLRE